MLVKTIYLYEHRPNKKNQMILKKIFFFKLINNAVISRTMKNARINLSI